MVAIHDRQKLTASSQKRLNNIFCKRIICLHLFIEHRRPRRDTFGHDVLLDLKGIKFIASRARTSRRLCSEAFKKRAAPWAEPAGR